LKKENLMKSRKFEVEALDARIVPAVLTVHSSLAEPPADHTTVVVSSPAPVPAIAAIAVTPPRGLDCKLAVNHNEMLVRARRGRKHRRR
jgi:hypothetical protein